VGLLAPLAMFSPSLWVVPTAGILLCVAALRRIASRAPALLGRRSALVGLVVSVTCLAAATSEWTTRRWLIDHEARRFALQWFEFLSQDEPHKACQLSVHPGGRAPLDDKLWDSYAPDPDHPGKGELESFLSEPAVRTLLALGKQAHPRYYDTERQWRERGDDLVDQVYAVTYQEAGQKKSFFVRLILRRSTSASSGVAGWSVVDNEGGVRPKALKGGRG
jgi:hypothetical protein